jgi:hypothetical protein
MSVIETPCRNVCQLDRAGALCTGCGRTVAEIAAWTRYTPQQRSEIIKQLPARMAAALPS